MSNRLEVAKHFEETGRLDPPRLVKRGGGTISVTVSHLELGNLVGELMQMCELNGDVEQRDALKRTIKQISRNWLDDIYEEAGYSNYKDIQPKYSVLDGSPKNN